MVADSLEAFRVSETFVLQNGRSIPINSLTIGISLVGNGNDTLAEILKRNKLETETPGYFYRCLSKSTIGGENSPYRAYRDQLKENGLDRPIMRIKDFQTTSNKADFAYFHIKEFKNLPHETISIVLIYNPLNNSTIRDAANFDAAQAASLFDQIANREIQENPNAFYNFLTTTLERVIEIHWEK
ncbi:MAG TPA: hypothetical protein VMR81_08145 [Patescibacteria group bacterium]|nr:hypothetical protein [Patescibacteria group bacterium]